MLEYRIDLTYRMRTRQGFSCKLSELATNRSQLVMGILVMAPSRSYSSQELVEIYRQYAELKGWNTHPDAVQGKVEAWVDLGIGPVGLAIDFYECGRDGAKHLGYDAEARSKNSPIQHLVVAVAGMTYPNADGSSREEIAAQCSIREGLRLHHEPENEFDSNAIGVFRKNGQQIGYLPRRVAAETVARMARGFRHVAVVATIDGSDSVEVDMSNATSAEPVELSVVLFIIAADVSVIEWKRYYNAWKGK